MIYVFICRYLYAVVGMEAFHDVEMGEFVLTYGAYDCNLGFQDFKYVFVLLLSLIHCKRGNFRSIHSIWIFAVILSWYKARDQYMLILKAKDS